MNAEMVQGSDGVWRVVEPERIQVTARAPFDLWPLLIVGGLIVFFFLRLPRAD